MDRDPSSAPAEPERRYRIVARKRTVVEPRALFHLYLIAATFLAVGAYMAAKSALTGSMSTFQSVIMIATFIWSGLFAWYAIAFRQLKKLEARQFLAVDLNTNELVLAHSVRDRSTRSVRPEHRLPLDDIVEIERLENPQQSWIHLKTPTDVVRVQGPYHDIESLLEAIKAPVSETDLPTHHPLKKLFVAVIIFVGIPAAIIWLTIVLGWI